jgi:succinate dehydrogenase / fumarate reductase, cytochrome b subunit
MEVAATVIEVFVAALTIAAGLFALVLVVDLLRIGRGRKGRYYKGGIGQWSWAAHRVTGFGVMAFLIGHIVDTFGAGFGPELYDNTIALYQTWWFKPFEVLLVGAVLYHALNGLRIIMFDFWPRLALKQRGFAYVELVLFVVGFLPAAFFMLRSAYENSPFA